jgi:hypothetical protein
MRDVSYVSMNKFLLFLLLPFSSCEQTVPVNRIELKQVFKAIDEGDLLKTKEYIVDSIDDFSTKSIRQEKIVYKIAELKELRNGLWSNVIFDSAKIVRYHFIDSISDTDRFKTMPSHYRFSLPYFNKDKTAFIIYYNYYCGSLCAEYSLRLYRKINGRWKFIKTFYRIVS